MAYSQAFLEGNQSVEPKGLEAVAGQPDVFGQRREGARRLWKLSDGRGVSRLERGGFSAGAQTGCWGSEARSNLSVFACKAGESVIGQFAVCNRG